MWNLKYDTNALVYKTEGDPQTSKTNFIKNKLTVTKEEMA